MKQLRVTVQGKVYEVSVEILEEGGRSSAAPLQTPVSAVPAASLESPAPAASAAGSGGPGSIESPLAGKVMEVKAAVGQAVKQGDQLVVLEAMKMNTYVQAPQDGVVAEVFVKTGDAVAEGQALLRLAAQ